MNIFLLIAIPILTNIGLALCGVNIMDTTGIWMAINIPLSLVLGFIGD